MDAPSRYRIHETPAGVRGEGADRPPVEIALHPFSLEAAFAGDLGPVVRERFGLVEFGPAADELGEEYDKLAVDGAVQEARAQIERNKMGSAKLIRKSVALSPLGTEFWAACAPRR